MLKLENIKKDYQIGDQLVHALRGISVDFRKNEFVTILGPSGCGKTTLLNIIGGLDQYTLGDLIIDNVSTKNFKDKDWDNYRNKKIGFVFQSYNLIPHQSVIGNVELALALSGMSKEERFIKAKKALEQVGLHDQLHKKPNQLSGGQMQRVAIARAIVNEPEILLMDEPTGALDTVTSKQIMELITKVAKDKLVIMVTHNPELASKYATRLLRMVDGEIIEDTNPFSSKKEEKVSITKINKKSKTSMSFQTALVLSLRNLFTKKGRTILTAIAGSIGIIGIALILSISSGMNEYISKIQADSLSSSPITVSTTTFDLNQATEASKNHKVWEKYPKQKEVYIQEINDASDLMKKNNITEEYIDYVKGLDDSWYNDLIFKTGLELNLFTQKKDGSYRKLDSTGQSSSFSGTVWQMLVEEDFLNTQFDILAGHYPTKANEIILIVDEYNRVSEDALLDLGIINSDEDIDDIDFDDIIGREYKFVSNDELYTQLDGRFIENAVKDINFSNSYTFTIQGIFRVNEKTTMGVLSSGVGYTKDFYAYIQETNFSSKLIEWMNDNPSLNPLTGTAFENTPLVTKEEARESLMRKLGGVNLPNEISIYPVDFKTKDNIKTYLDNYNVDKEASDMITYLDLSDLIGKMFGTMVDVITYVLVGFTSISLVVSSIMIAIITYVSVLERTKEIGILRSIGARKKDITRVFNAETFIIGLLAGVFGVALAFILNFPINLIIENLTDVSDIAYLPLSSAFILVLISVLLTVLSGLIPAYNASKKDPVLALRTE